MISGRILREKFASQAWSKIYSRKRQEQNPPFSEELQEIKGRRDTWSPTGGSQSSIDKTHIRDYIRTTKCCFYFLHLPVATWCSVQGDLVVAVEERASGLTDHYQEYPVICLMVPQLAVRGSLGCLGQVEVPGEWLWFCDSYANGENVLVYGGSHLPVRT